MNIRTRLTLQFIFIMAGILVVFSLAIRLATGFSLQKSVDDVMQQQATLIANTALRSPGGFTHITQQKLDNLVGGEVSVQIQDPYGFPVASSTSWLERHFSPALVQRTSPTDQVVLVAVKGSDMYLYRHAVSVDGRLQGYVVLARSAEIGSLALKSLADLLLPGVILNIGLGGLLVWFLVSRATRPLERLSAKASEIAEASDHSLRLQPQGPSDEINRLVYTINGMLQSLEDAYQQVQQVNDLQRHFLADVSHELRTPLTIMLSSLDLLKKERGTDPDFQANALENLRGEAERMARMVTQLLLLARTDASATLAREPLLVADIVADICRQDQQTENKITLECQGLAQLEDAVVSGSADYLKQLFLILLENAFKYTPGGGQVGVSGTLKGDTVTITVADTGIGIAAADLPKVFDRFYRAENARFRSGLGLGLSIAQSIAEQHGGEITVESAPGQGSRFTVALPLLNQVDTPVSLSAGAPLADVPRM
jgi:two-component system, OmpR family, sensor kinase